MKAKSNIFKIGIMGLVLLFSCTDLSETLYDEIPQEEFFKTEEELVSAFAPLYGNLRSFCGDMWDLNSIVTDQTVVPTKDGGHWYEGGHFQRLHEHTWTPETPQINYPWNFNYNLINNANKLLYQIEGVDSMEESLKALFVAELKMIRGFAYYNLIDLYGNIPLILKWDQEDRAPTNKPRKEVFDFVVNDIETSINDLSDKVDATTYGRFHLYAAYTLLAKFYLNAEVWTGSSNWDKVIEYCDKVINSGKFVLEPNYFNNFLINNENSKENIFVIPYDEVYTADSHLYFHLRCLHYSNKFTYGFSASPWNGHTAIPSFIHSFDEEDKRLEGWLIGQQYSSSGDTLYCNQGVTGPLIYTIDFVNVFNPNDGVTYDHTFMLEFMGARFAKYEYGPTTGSMSNDYAVYRYADILMTKAEAIMRKNNGVATSDAVDLINQVRGRSLPPEKLYSTSTLTMDALLAERGWEFYGEAVRRNDLVRFNKFVNGTWEFYDRSNESSTRNLFPIPQPQINANPNLSQNPGY